MSIPTGERVVVRGALVAAAALVVAAPTPLESLRTLSDAGSAPVVTDPLVALVALLAWCCAAYLLAVAALTAGSRLPAVGPALAALARRAAPAGLRRALEVALGVSLVVGTLGAGTAAAAGPGAPPGGPLAAQTAYQTPAVPAPVVAPLPGASPSLDHPVATPSLETPAEVPPAPSLDHPVAASPTPSLDHPVAASPTPSLDHPTTSPVSPTSPAEPVASAPVPAAADPAPPAAEPVVVQAGDSLWSLAEEQLEQQTGGAVSDRQVAAAWPSWWQANREAVGDDPDLLHPGTPLVPPTDS